MSKQLQVKAASPRSFTPARSGLLQRKCACGQHSSGGECEDCKKKREGTPQKPPFGAQAKLTINQPVDALEQEADRMADAVVSNQTAPVNRSPSALPLRRGEGPRANNVQPTMVHEVLNSPGQPLDAETSAYMESRFGHDFSQVRVHTDAHAADSARALNALAYTVGSDLVFKDQEYRPGTTQGLKLLAHELTHVIQQRKAPAPAVLQRKDDTPSQPKELAVEAPQKTCDEALDITEVFRGFVRNYPGAIGEMAGLSEDQKKGFRDMLDFVLSNDAGVDAMKWKVLSCKKINLELAVGDEKFEAYFDRANKTLGLSEEFVSKLTPALRDKDTLLHVISVLAHEKRHATLGSSVSVLPSALKGEPTQSKAQNAAYRAEEILAVAEQIGVERMALGSEYEVPEQFQRRLHRLTNMIRNWVQESEFQRLRKLIIDKLRDRYGFSDGCDNALTVGVVRSMDRNEWFSCDRENRTIYGPVPEGLNICSDDKHAFCRKKQ